MKKSLLIMIGLITAILLVSSVSAFWPFDKTPSVTGHTLKNARNAYTESDGGIVIGTAGAAADSRTTYFDACRGDLLQEWYVRTGLFGGKYLAVYPYYCPYGCESVDVTFDGTTMPAGQCKPQQKECTEIGDTGNDANTAGIVIVTRGSSVSEYPDEQVGSSIKEWYCPNAESEASSALVPCAGRIMTSVVSGSNGKSASYCRVYPLTCTATDTGVSFTNERNERGDQSNTCVGNNRLTTWSCNAANLPISNTETCSSGRCSGNACASTTCTDTDNGKIWRTKGTATATTTSAVYTQTDVCIGPKKLIEFSCFRPTATRLNANVVNCLNECSNGACTGAGNPEPSEEVLAPGGT